MSAVCLLNPNPFNLAHYQQTLPPLLDFRVKVLQKKIYLLDHTPASNPPLRTGTQEINISMHSCCHHTHTKRWDGIDNFFFEWIKILLLPHRFMSCAILSTVKEISESGWKNKLKLGAALTLYIVITMTLMFHKCTYATTLSAFG